MYIRRSYMLWPNTEADGPRWKALQCWPALYEFHNGRNSKGFVCSQNSADDSILNENLGALRYFRREFPPFLYCLKERRELLARRQR